MAIRLHFWGAAQTVTGSSHHLECSGQNVLLDCGLFQGHRQQAREINEHLALPAEQVNAVVLSHAHIDHSGNLPLLVKQGYRGPIYTTPSTVDLCEKMLKDSAHIQESDAEFVNRRAHRRRSIGVAPDGEAVAPLYTQADAEQTVQQFKPVTMHTPQLLAGSTADAGFTTTTFDAEHMLGSTCVLVEGADDAAVVFGRCGAEGVADYQGSGDGSGCGVSDHGEYVWESPASAFGAGEDLLYRSGELMHGQVLEKVSPIAPETGLRAVVVLKLHVDTTGAVESASIVSSQNQILKNAALTAVKQWRYRVSYQGDKLVPVDVDVELNFGSYSGQ